MCGIAGLIAKRERAIPAEELERVARGMAATLRHRGPDGEGVWLEAARGVALAHRRLAILDPGPLAAQPIVSRCGRYALVHNGEIYNWRDLRRQLEARGHVFRSASDSEVLVEAISAWGVAAAVERSDGMFAFALWDRSEGRLHLVRDRIGKKPLYWWRRQGEFYFASELKAFARVPGFAPEIDRDALGHLIQFSYIPAPRTIYRGVYKLESGSWLCVDADKPDAEAAPQRFWSVQEMAEIGQTQPWRGSFAEAEEVLHELLRDAVERRMIADVPVGALFSGGVDSSMVVALMQSLRSAPIRTFAIGFHEDDYDETRHARAVARHLGSEHRDIVVTPYQALEVIPRLPLVYDEPFADTSQIPTLLVSQLARSEVTVALSGDGGDELFAGYARYPRCQRRWQALAPMPQPLRRGAAGFLGRLASRGWEEGGPRRLGGLERPAEWIGAPSLPDLFRAMNARCSDPADYVIGAEALPGPFRDNAFPARQRHPIDWMMSMDLAGHLPEDILVKVDRASMAVGLEVRAPLLDHRVVELALRLPLEFKLQRGEQKRILRRVLERYLPREFCARPKMGFGLPLDAWLRGPLRAWAEELLDERRLRQAGWYEVDAVRRAWEQHLAGWRDRRLLLWNLLSFEAWRDAQVVGSG